jgi:cytochrome P450/NADPH-cytochrome P450 reductase
MVLLLLSKIHLDKRVYGETAEQFVPERMLEENFERLLKEFPDCWKPFGNGMRACIGRPFAWQEAVLVMAVLLQNFDFSFDDPNYALQYKQTLTVKPKDFYMRATLRHGQTPTELEHRLCGGLTAPSAGTKSKSGTVTPTSVSATAAKDRRPMSIYYGSNTGTCESLAQRLAMDAASHGFAATVVEPMDAAKASLPTDRPVVIITASYEGQPPDNAAEFCGWIEGLKGAELQNVSYAVFGCGHHDWSQTFHRIPTLVDRVLEARGGSRICKLGLTDVAEGDMFTDFEQWEDEVFWPALEARYGGAAAAGAGTEAPDSDALSPRLSVRFSNPRSSTLRQDVKEATVVSEKLLTAPISSATPKKHIEIQLPEGVTYRVGDYLAVLPVNPRATIYRVMRRFELAWDAHITIGSDRWTALPTDNPVPVFDVLGSYVELSQPATKRVRTLPHSPTAPNSGMMRTRQRTDL